MRSATSSKRWATTLGDNALDDAFRRFKDLADKKKHVFDEDIAALVDDEIVARPRPHQVRELARRLRNVRAARRRAELSVDGENRRVTTTGDGPVDAIFNAIKNFFRTTPRCDLPECMR